MAQPTPYDRITNFQNDQALAPLEPYPAPEFDQEYNAVKITTDEIIQNLSLIQRDDGHLANNSVGRDQLDPAIPLGFGEPTQWKTGVGYVLGNTVFADNGFYYCELDHISNVFAADLAAGKWSLLADFAQSTNEAEAAAAAAAVSANNSANSATASAGSATAAAGSATNAANSATAAANSALAASAANAFPWKYDTSITMADPGVGDVRLNNATLASVTQIALSAQSSVAGNPDVSDWIVTWDDSTSSAKGTITIRKASAPQNFAVYRVTGAVTDVGVFVQVPVAYVTHAGSFVSVDQLNVEFARTGDTGTTTVVGGVPEAVSDGTIYGRKDAAWTAVVATNAAGVAFSAAGAISSTNVQAAIQELDTEKADTASVVTKTGNNTVTGDLTIAKADPLLTLDKVASGQRAAITGSKGALPRWRVSLGTNTAESGSNAGSDFAIARYNDAGGALADSLTISRATGLITVEANPTAALGVATKSYVDGLAPPPAATAAEFISNSAPTKLLTSGATWGAANIVALVEAGSTVTPDLSLGIDFSWALGGAGRTIANPTNLKPGQKGAFILSPGASGTITTWGSAYRFPGGVKPLLTLNGVDIISYLAAGTAGAPVMYCTSAAGFA